MSILPLTIPPKKLAQTISSSDMTFKMNNIVGWGGANLTPADFGTEAYGVFINSTRTQIEVFKFDPATIASASVTILVRGLPYNGGDTSIPANKYPWPSNDTIVQLGTDAPQLFRDFMAGTNTATVSALHTYTTLPRSAVTPTNAQEFTNKNYVDGLTQPAITVPISQTGHGFAVGDVIRLSGVNTYAKAQANNAANAEVIGIVTEIVSPDAFKYITEGIVTTGVPVFAAGTVLFLSPTTAGALTDVEPSTVGQVSLPLVTISESGVRMVFHKFRGFQINTIAGNPLASETTAGIVEEATQAQVNAGIDTGETGARLFVVPSKLPVPPSGAETTLTSGTRITIDTTSGPRAVFGFRGGSEVMPIKGIHQIGTIAGFVKSGVTVTPKTQISAGSTLYLAGTGTIASFTAAAGNNRGILFGRFHSNSDTTGVTWNGIPFTQILDAPGNSGADLWFLPIGDSLTDQTFTLTYTAGSGVSSDRQFACVIENVAQTNYLGGSVANTAGNAIGGVIPSQEMRSFLLAISFGTNSGNIITYPTDGTQLGSNISIEVRTFENDHLRGLDFKATTSGTLRITMGVELKSAVPLSSVDVSYGKVTGFTGLTPNELYYVDDSGYASTNPGTNVIIAGVAVDTTTIDVQSTLSQDAIDVQQFEDGGSWAKPIRGSLAFIELWGGGGSGTSTLDTTATYAPAAGAGAGGEYKSMLIPINILPSFVGVTIGQGGAAKSNATGEAGALSSFGSYLIANGGNGGGAATQDGTVSAGGVGGTGGTALVSNLITEAGGNGGQADSISPTLGSPGSNTTNSGAGGGGAAYYSSGPTASAGAGGVSQRGGNGGAGAVQANATDGVVPGGGGGASVSYGSTPYLSGAGAAGYCRVTVF